jgi:hypothetical protein
MGSGHSRFCFGSTSIYYYECRDKSKIWHFFLGIASIILAIRHQDINEKLCSGIPSIPSVLSGDYREVIFLDALQFRENHSICPMLLPALVHWSNLANPPFPFALARCLLLIASFLSLISFERICGRRARHRVGPARLYDWASVFVFTQFHDRSSNMDGWVAIGYWLSDLRPWGQRGGDGGEQ